MYEEGLRFFLVPLSIIVTEGQYFKIIEKRRNRAQFYIFVNSSQILTYIYSLAAKVYN